MKRIWILVVAMIVMAGVARAAEPEKPKIAKEKVAEIEKTLRLVGVEKLMAQMKTNLFGMFREQAKGLPEDYWKRAEEKFNTRELLDLIIPLYDKYYTTEDLKAMNAFYESAAGQKVLATLPQITQESMKIGQAWGEDVALRLQKEVELELKQKRDKKADKPL